VPTRSAGILLYRHGEDGGLEVLLGHLGGPFWAKKDDGAWGIFKGEYVPGEEDPLDAARREFEEETGSPAPDAEPLALGEARQSTGKLVLAWALEGDLDADSVESNSFEMEWPPKSGQRQSFPEIDRAAWFDTTTARRKLLPAQVGFVDELGRLLA
jgi:predicted NUDIX family NTP pyrophosphohydrolase